MTIDDVREAATALGDFAQRHGQPVLFGAGAAGALLALVLVWRFLRTGHAHTKLGRVAVTLATAFAMEGMYEVASGPLGLNTFGSLMFCATFEVVMLHQGSLAAHKLAAHVGDGPAPNISRHMRFVWLVAAASGTIASTASDSMTEVVLRLVTPPLAAGIWYMSLYADKEPAERQPSRWIWTPQRIGVRLGLLKPGTVDDLTEVFQQRRIAALVDAGLELYAEREAAKLRGNETAKRSRWALRNRQDPLVVATQKVQRLTKTADREAVKAARDQLRLTLNIENVLLGQAGEVDDWTRQQLDRVQAETTRAVRTLRSQGHLARGHGLPPRPRPEPTVEVAGIRMPAHLAAQIGPLPAQPGGSPAAHDEARRESATDSPKAATAAQRPERMTVTESVREPAQKTDDKPLRSAHARLTKKLGREPTGEELGQAAGVSKATANRWKRDRISK